MRRPCLDCGILVATGSRCDTHQQAAEARRGNTTLRGYGSAWQRLSAQVLDRDAHYCQIRGPKCQGIATTVDHIVPISRGGQLLDRDNCQAACRPCNSRKGNR